jgi:hypothetical protein
MPEESNPYGKAIEQQRVRQWLRKLDPVRLGHGRSGLRSIQKRLVGVDQQPAEDARDRQGGEKAVGGWREDDTAAYPTLSFIIPCSIFTQSRIEDTIPNKK